MRHIINNMAEEQNELIKLHNSNALQKFPVDAVELNHNFEYLDQKTGVPLLETFIESTGLTYFPENTGQLASAVAQYIASAGIYNEVSTTDNYQLEGLSGMYTPFKCTEGMVVTFKPSHTNDGNSTIQLGTDESTKYPIYAYGNEIAPGYMPIGVFASFVLVKNTYNNNSIFCWERTATPASGDLSTESSSGSEDNGATTNYATVAIKTAIQSAGIEFDAANLELLQEAISRYVASSCYKATYVSGVYTLSPILSTMSLPSDFFDGMIVSFICPNQNNVSPMFIKLEGNASQVEVREYNGAQVRINSLVKGQLLTAVYTDGFFVLLSNYTPSIILKDGNVLSGITSDASLATDDSTVTASVPAIKQYVESHIRGSYANTIINGYTDESGGVSTPAALSKSGGHELCLISGTGSFRANTPNSPTNSGYTENIIVSSNTNHAHQLVDLIENTYWETASSGFRVDDIARIVVETTDGDKSLQQSFDANDEPIYYNTPPEPEYFGLLDIDHSTTHVKIKFTDASHAPSSAAIEVQLPLGEGGALEWVSVYTPDGTACSINVDDSDQSSDQSYTQQFIFSGTETQKPVVYYYYSDSEESSDNNVVPFIIENDFTLNMRVVVTSFNQQELSDPSLEGYNAGDTYNVDTQEDTKRPLQVSYFQVGTLIDAPVFELAFPNATLYSAKSGLYFTQYDSDDTNAESSMLTSYNNGKYACLVLENQNELSLVPKDNILKQNSIPTPSEDLDGYVLYHTITETPDTYMCTSRTVAGSVDREVTYYGWEYPTQELYRCWEHISGNVVYPSNYIIYTRGSTVSKYDPFYTKSGTNLTQYQSAYQYAGQDNNTWTGVCNPYWGNADTIRVQFKGASVWGLTGIYQRYPSGDTSAETARTSAFTTDSNPVVGAEIYDYAGENANVITTVASITTSGGVVVSVTGVNGVEYTRKQSYDTTIVIPAEVEYYWDKVNLIPVGDVTFFDNTITSVENYSYGVNLRRAFSATPTMLETITHNFGESVNVECFLTCVSAELGYSVGRRIRLNNYSSDECSLVPTTVTKDVFDFDYSTQTSVKIGEVTVQEYSLTKTTSYVIIQSDSESAVIDIKNLKLPDLTNGGTPALISDGKWVLNVYINKE